MNEKIESMDPTTSARLDELLAYVHRLGELNQKPIFRIEEYKQLNIWEHELKGKIGIQHNIVGADGVSIWLKIERLKRIPPPLIPERIQEWVSVGNDPEKEPQIKQKLIKTLPADKAQKLVEGGIVLKNDVIEPLKKQSVEIKLKDVIFQQTVFSEAL